MVVVVVVVVVVRCGGSAGGRTRGQVPYRVLVACDKVPSLCTTIRLEWGPQGADSGRGGATGLITRASAHGRGRAGGSHGKGVEVLRV